jgi:hypothetical protein
MSGCLLRACQRPNITDGNAKQTPAVHVKTFLQKKNSNQICFFLFLV